jgi:UDP-GlcNAc:undecaprenyl-phosphate/decaprenyl-phosphate GlcNAc-1-phosphate transferase
MSPELRSVVCFVVAAIATYFATPLAIRAAVRLSFFDVPAGYKGHRKPTPYLGGSAIMFGLLLAGLAASGALEQQWQLIVCAVFLWGLGTLDDWLNLPLSVRLLAEVAIAVGLWHSGHGWDVFNSTGPDVALTVVWVVGVANAFNLMDNMDGAAATTAAVSALGAGLLAIISGKAALAPLCFAVAGSCAGFLPGNLARPARIFMGDGGSLPIGLLVAGLTMSVVTRDYFGTRGIIIGPLLVGLVILDTTLVTVSRRRGHRAVLSGGRDHLTHRLVNWVGSPRTVALMLAATQLLVCAATIAIARAGWGWVLLAGGAAVAFGLVMIWQLERIPFFTAAVFEERSRGGVADSAAEAVLATEPDVQTAHVRPSLFPWQRRRQVERQAERITA